MESALITLLFEEFSANNPQPQTELLYTTPYTLLVAVTLSAQATDVGVNKATRGLFEKVRTPQDMLDLGLDGLIAHIKTIGLYPTKARHIMETARLLVAHHQGEVPSSREDLEALPGVGRKTANVVLNVAFGQPTIPVDTHIFRVANRLGLTNGTTPLQVEEQLNAVVPEHFKPYVHHWLILHGRYVCKARKPVCEECLVSAYCAFNLNLQPSIDNLCDKGEGGESS